MTVHVWIEAGMTDWRTDGITRRIFQRPHSADWRTYCRCIKETSTRCTAASASRSVVAMSSFYSRTAFLVVSVLTAWSNSKGHLTFLHVAAIITNVVLYCRSPTAPGQQESWSPYKPATLSDLDKLMQTWYKCSVWKCDDLLSSAFEDQ